MFYNVSLISSLSTIGKVLFSISIVLPHSWPYELLTFFFSIDYLFLAATCFLITHRTSPNGPSHVVLVRRASDFIGIAICASIFGALGIRQRWIWAALIEVIHDFHINIIHELMISKGAHDARNRLYKSCPACGQMSTKETRCRER